MSIPKHSSHKTIDESMDALSKQQQKRNMDATTANQQLTCL